MTANRREALPGPTRAQVVRIAWPIILANASAPLLGLADTAVIGNTGTVAELGAIALGALIFNFLFWSFIFLRMGTTGFVAQADGAGDAAEIRASTLRPLLLGLGIGAVLVALQRPIADVALALLGGGDEVQSIASDYLLIRIWSAPAALGSYALSGALVGLGASRRLLAVQVFLNGLNVVLDIVLAGVLGLGAQGVALGTAIAEWASLAVALWLVARLLRSRAPGPVSWARVFDLSALRGMLGTHSDILLRSLLLLAGFGWFVHVGATFGDATLAANHVLLQLISFAAFFLDGFANAAESLVGRAKGAGRRDAFDRAVRSTTELALASAVLLAGAAALAGEACVRALTDLPEVRAVASGHLAQATVYIAVSAAAFQLDGIFIGVLRTKAMRNAAAAALLGFLALSWALVGPFGNDGLWLAFIGYVVLRAVSLGALFPSLRRSIGI